MPALIRIDPQTQAVTLLQERPDVLAAYIGVLGAGTKPNNKWVPIRIVNSGSGSVHVSTVDTLTTTEVVRTITRRAPTAQEIDAQSTAAAQDDADVALARVMHLLANGLYRALLVQQPGMTPAEFRTFIGGGGAGGAPLIPLATFVNFIKGFK